MALTPEEKTQAGIDIIAAGFARPYGGTEGDSRKFDHIYTGVVMEAVNTIVATQRIDLPKRGKQDLLQAIGAFYYTTLAAAVMSTIDAAPDNVKKQYWAQARGMNVAFEAAYPALLKKVQAGTFDFIAKRWPNDMYTFPADNLGAVLHVDPVAAITPASDIDSLRRQNYYGLAEAVIRTDAGKGRDDSDMMWVGIEDAALSWLGKSAIATVAKTLPDADHSRESVNLFSTAYTSSIVAAEWFATPSANGVANDEAAASATRRSEYTSKSLRALYSDEALTKVAEAFFERAKAAVGMTGKKGRQDELKRFVYMAVGAQISDGGQAPVPPANNGGSSPLLS